MAPQRVANRLPNAAANLQRCLAGDWQIFGEGFSYSLLRLKISSAPTNRCCKFAAVIGRRAANFQ